MGMEITTKVDIKDTKLLCEAAHTGFVASLNALIQKEPIILHRVSLTT